HLDAYSTIIAASQGSEAAKQLAARFIPVFFKYFPSLHNKAIDGVFDLCEDDSSLIRQAAIKSLPSLCKDGQQHTIKIADVLCQLLQLDDQDLVVVQSALQKLMIQSPREVLAVIFRQGVKGADIRERALSFITHQVMESKQILFKDPEIELFFLEEMQKAMGSVSNAELEVFAKIIMQTKSYANGRIDLARLLDTYIQHITSEKPFNVTDQESIKRVLVTGMLSVPLFKRTISADPLLEFISSNILPWDMYNKVSEKQKTAVLRLYADSLILGHPSQAIVKAAGVHLTDLLVAIVGEDHGGAAHIEFAQVECLTNMLYDTAFKDPDLIEKEELAASLYMSTQTQIPSLKKALAAAQSKQSNDGDQAIIKNLNKAILMHNNIHTVVKEFLKPKHLRNSKIALHPSWKPVSEPTKPAITKTPGTTKPPATNVSKSTPTSKPSLKANSKPNSKLPIHQQQQQQQQQQPQQKQQQQQQQQNQVAPNKRKAEHDPTNKPKKPKIVRRHGSNTGSNSPGNSPGQQQQQSHHNQPPQTSQHSKKASGSFNGAPPRNQSNPASFDSRRGRDSHGKINFLKR
ncbi:Apoptosis inhibitor 5, partial [Entomortierella beljakovae]